MATAQPTSAVALPATTSATRPKLALTTSAAMDCVLLKHLRSTRSHVSTQRLQSLAGKDVPGMTRQRFVNSLARLVSAGKVARPTPYRVRCTALGRKVAKRQGPAKAAKKTKAPLLKETNAKRLTKQTGTKPNTSAAKQKKVKGQYTPSSGCKGVVDTQFHLASDYDVLRDPPVNGTTPGRVWDDMFVHRDLALGIDKFFAMQLLVRKHGPAQGHVADVVKANLGSVADVVVLTRHGRTGTRGQVRTVEFTLAQLPQAKVAYDKKALAKTGSHFASVARSEQPDAVGVAWQYYVDDGVDDKATGWYDYEPAASGIVENIHREWLLNPHLDVRRVQSGQFAYHVDFGTLTQTNVMHKDHKQRSIRRQVLAVVAGTAAA